MTHVKCTKLKPKGKHLDEDDQEYLEQMARQNRQLPKHKRLTQADMAIDDYLSDLLTICLSFFVV
ncbi:hypothetical protein [Dolosigranulum savutiense]|uniref:Uncharacterized protein n=1 Tax=Dolosigranulum savutiense TaxID=3110288 RepID=A0AB74U1J4_9LACT